jgi:YidC/Oxa1 family membrane protein insertase
LEKRLPLALFLSFLILLAWGQLNPPPEPAPTPASNPATSARGELSESPTDAGSPADEAGLRPSTRDALAPLEGTLEAEGEWSDWLELGRAGEPGHYWARFSNRGARLDELRLDGYWDSPDLTDQERGDREHWTQLLVDLETGRGRTGSLLLRASKSSERLVREPLDQVYWQHEVLEDRGATTGVRFTYAPGTGVTFVKTIEVRPGSYELTVDIELRNDNEAFTGPAQFVFVPASCVPPETADKFYIEPQAIAAWDSGGEVRVNAERKNERARELHGDLAGTGDLAFGGVHSKYFALLFYALDETTQATLLGASWKRIFDAEYVAENPGTENAGNRQIITELDVRMRIPEPGRTSVYAYSLYAGPKDRAVMAATHASFASLSREDLGFFTAIASILLAVLGFFQGLTGNWGISIILLTLSVRAVLFPLNRRSQTAMARHQTKMKRVQPKIDEIKKKYEGNAQKIRQEQARIMQEEGAFPPLSGCLPVFLQIPVFFGLFQMLRASFDLRQAPFLGWIEDLSKPDHLMRIDLNTHLPFIGTIEWLNVLPPIMVVLWVLQQRVMPKPTDEQAQRMQKMMMWMPVMFGFFLYNYAAGLSLYMITQSTMGILEQTVIKKTWPLDTSEQPKKKSGFMTRLAELQEKAQKQQEAKRRSQGGSGNSGGKRKKTPKG